MRINQVLEAVNAVIGELFASEVMGRDNDKQKPEPKTESGSGDKPDEEFLIGALVLKMPMIPNFIFHRMPETLFLRRLSTDGLSGW